MNKIELTFAVTILFREEYIKEESKGFEANSKHIAKFACRPNIKPQDPNEVSLAYEARIYPKLVRITAIMLLLLLLENDHCRSSFSR